MTGTGPPTAAPRRGGARVVAPLVIVALAWAAAGVAQGFGRFTYALVLPAVQEDLLGSYAVAGLLGTLNVAGYLLGTALVTVAATRTEPAQLVRLGLVGSAAGLTVSALAPNGVVLAAGMALAGLGGAFIWVPAPGLVGAVVHPSRRGLAVGLVGSGIGVSIVFASQLAGAVRRVAGDGAWRQVWGVEAGIAVVVLVLVLIWLRPPATEPAGAPVRVSALKEVPGWVGLTVGYASYGLTISLYMNYLVAALEEDAGFTPGHAAGVFAALGVAMAAGGVLVGRLSDRTGRRAALVAGYAALSVCPLLVLTGRQPWALVSAITFGLAMSGVPTVIAAHLSDTLHPRAFGSAFGALTLAFGVAQVAGPQLGGWLASRTGSFTLTFALAALAGLLGAAASRSLPRPDRTPATTAP